MTHRNTAIFYVSGHGFGHVSRQIEIINALASIQPNLQILVRTSAPRELFERGIQSAFSYVSGEPDTGVVQINSLQVDAAASIRRAWNFHRTLDARAENESQFLKFHETALVVGDIPPLAFAAANIISVPAVAIANFTWDWIYAQYKASLSAAPDLLTVIRNAYATADMAWRLPMSGGFSSFSRVVDAPLVARHARHTSTHIRDALQLPSDRPLALVSFGRYGLDTIDWATATQQNDFAVIVTRDLVDAGPAPLDKSARDLAFEVDVKSMFERGLHYEDLVAAVDVVVTKPGYGIIAECAANNTALVYTSRGDFAEYPILVKAMPKLLRCAHIHQRDLFAGRWTPVVREVLEQPQPTESTATDGAQVIALGLSNYL